MDIVEMIQPIILVTNHVLPKPPLPDPFFASVINPGHDARGQIVFDQTPTQRKVAVALEKLPNRV